jgi:hypothetical protein
MKILGKTDFIIEIVYSIPTPARLQTSFLFIAKNYFQKSDSTNYF